MPTIKKILVPTDFSPSAEVAVQRAEELAHAVKAQLILLYVVDISPMLVADGAGYVPMEEFEEFEERAKHRLDASTRRLSDAGLSVRGLLARGTPTQTIVDIARDEGVALIVMGTHGRTGVRRLVLGSVAERVSRTATVPVMTVRAGPHAAEARAQGKAPLPAPA